MCCSANGDVFDDSRERGTPLMLLLGRQAVVSRNLFLPLRYPDSYLWHATLIQAGLDHGMPPSFKQVPGLDRALLAMRAGERAHVTVQV